VVVRVYNRYPLLEVLQKFIVDYPTPANISYLWNLGVLAALCLGIQIITGIFLAMFYVPTSFGAFDSIQYIMRDVNNGWLIRYIHANGASFFFLCIYLHVFRGLYYNSYLEPRQLLWIVGVIILVLAILTAFLGYVLPWGQMSFWAATVITSLFSAIPLIGENIVIWLWGGYSVDNSTLNRFFSLHYLFPFIIAFFSLLHIIILHNYGSTNPTALQPVDKVMFHPYFTSKDFLGINLFMLILCCVIFFFPDNILDPTNSMIANPLITPTHIVPEWYFLPFYAILRSIPDKLIGVIILVLAISILFILPFFATSNLKFNFFDNIKVLLFWFFIFTCILLGWIGFKPIETPYLSIGQFLTVVYFFYFILLFVISDFWRFFSRKTFNPRPEIRLVLRIFLTSYRRTKLNWHSTRYEAIYEWVRYGYRYGPAEARYRLPSKLVAFIQGRRAELSNYIDYQLQYRHQYDQK
jgi:quinol-cytochrome oxidoreductase complex cytochrome b subunit